MPGTITSRSFWLALKIAPNRPRKSSGSRKLKNAALGLRQNSLRSRRYCLHVSAASDLIGGELKVDLLERWPDHLEVLETLASREGVAGQLVQEGGGVVGDLLVVLARRVAPRHPDTARGL